MCSRLDDKTVKWNNHTGIQPFVGAACCWRPCRCLGLVEAITAGRELIYARMVSSRNRSRCRCMRARHSTRKPRSS
jgi:hypothetical protein